MTEYDDQQRCADAMDYLATVGVQIEEAGDRTDLAPLVALWPSKQIPAFLLKDAQ